MPSFMDIEVNDLMTLAGRAQHFAEQRLAGAVTVSGIMSRPVHRVPATASMSEAAHLMVTTRISGLPVVDQADRLAGLITEADFLRALGIPAHPPSQNLWQTLESLFGHLARHPEVEGPNDPVSEHMTRHVVCASPQQEVQEVLALMARHRVKRLPVCDDDRRPVGMITRSDLVRLFFDRYTGAARPGPE
jgi:CBS domain-containing protein